MSLDSCIEFTGMKKLLFISLLSTIVVLANAQVKFLGKVVSDGNGVSNAYVLFASDSGEWSDETSEDGSFSVTLPEGNYVITITHVSYADLSQKVSVTPTNNSIIIELQAQTSHLDAAIINSIRARKTTPSTQTNLTKEELVQMDQQKDFPFVLNLTPSTVVSSDAGNGIGYTGIRIRGIDPTRVNVTINGIPLNDAESQGVFWVNLPDLASSTQSVQIQRGVGTSSNGAAAFGASVNIRTNNLDKEQFSQLTTGFGSFGSQRYTFIHNTGRLKNNLAFQVRGSSIESDGFIDRASTNLRSANIIGAKYWDKASLKANLLLGQERTYQAWWGIPQPKFEQNNPELQRYINELWITGDDLDNLNNSDRRTYNYYTYENEVDNYNQNHYQLFFDRNIDTSWDLHLAGYLTTGAGYFEQYRPDEDYSDYNVPTALQPGDTSNSGELVRRRWLDNTLVGALSSLTYQKGKVDGSIGLGMNQYAGKHFGEVISTSFSAYEGINQRYYDNDAFKTEVNVFGKLSYRMGAFVPYIDLQFRQIGYTFEGFDNQYELTEQSVNYGFFNPKVGFSYLLRNSMIYAMYARGNREPVRDDFRNSPPDNWPKHEQLDNIEFGYRYSRKRTSFTLNGYLMEYQNQLVLTGAVNDVGEPIRANMKESYRRGIELEAQTSITKKLQIGGNLNLSTNKIASFTEEVGSWDTSANLSVLRENTDISFSPNMIGALILGYKVNKNWMFQANAKHVAKQYLDNTQSDNSSLPAFTVLNASASYTADSLIGTKSFSFGIYLNNLLDATYAPLGYTYSGVMAGQRSDFNYVFPMAGRNVMVKASIRL